MRLTLRTLLAYMDEILEPEDQASIGSKIQESEFANNLLVRTRDVVRRMRLGAPQVVGRGLGLDPNTVAEYLDNTLPPERVSEFEKVCLESDVHLAETAASHQILTLVLGEPADVDPASRDRMYHIPELAEELARKETPTETAALAADGAATAASEAAAPANGGAKKHRDKLEVPDYLRESKRSRWKLKAALVALAAMIVVAAVVLIDPGGVLSDMFPTELPSHVQNDVELPEEGGPVPPQTELGAGEAEGEDAGELLDPAGGPAPPFKPGKAGGEAPVYDPNQLEPGGKVTPPVALGEPSDEPPISQPKLPAGDGGDVPPVPDAGPNEDVPNEVGPNEVAKVPGEALPGALPKDKAPQGKEAAAGSGVAPDGEKVLPPDIEDPVHVGVYASPDSVLARLNSATGQWERLDQRTTLASGEKVLALPTFRPIVNLAGGVSLLLTGGTSVVLKSPAAEGSPRFEVEYGAVIVARGVGGEETRIVVEVGAKPYEVALSEPNSTLAVRVRRVHQAGTDPESAPAKAIVDFYAPAGPVTWTAAGANVESESAMHWRMDGTVVAADVEELHPAWIDSEQLTGSDRLASMDLKQNLTSDRSINLGLLELMNVRRSEVRSLAARCAVYVGEFEPFVRALADQDQRATWTQHIDTLREAMALGPNVAQKVRDAFRQHAGNDGPALYRMLWGYSNNDLAGGADKQLVDYLKHDKLEFRVLAFWNLKLITGLGLNYGPEYPESLRARSMQRWEQKLAAGEIRLKAPPPTEAAPPVGEVEPPAVKPEPADGPVAIPQ